MSARDLRAHQLAKQLGVSAKEVRGRLAELGAPAKSPSSTVKPEAVGRLFETYGLQPSTHPEPLAARTLTVTPVPPTDTDGSGGAPAVTKPAARKKKVRQGPVEPLSAHEARREAGGRGPRLPGGAQRERQTTEDARRR